MQELPLEELDSEALFALYALADQYFLRQLKIACAIRIRALIDLTNVVDFLGILYTHVADADVVLSFQGCVSAGHRIWTDSVSAGWHVTSGSSFQLPGSGIPPAFRSTSVSP